jgi:hypothetical protein
MLAQHRPHQRRRRWALRRVEIECTLQDIRDTGRDVLDDLISRDKRIALSTKYRHCARESILRRSVRQQVVQRCGERVEVAPRIGSRSLDLFE